MRALAAALGWLGVALGALATLSFFGSLFWVLDLVASFRPQLSAVLVAVGLLAVAGRAATGWAAIAIGVLGLASMMPHLADASPPIAAESPTVRVMSFNVGISNPNRSAVAEFIGAENPDVVFIFESSFEWEDTIRAAGLPLQLVSVVPRDNLAGVTVLARPDLRPRRIDVDLGGEVAAVEVDLGDERITVLGIHPLSPTTAARAAARDRLILEAADWVAEQPGEVVLVGDLNATPWSQVYSTLRWRGGLVDTLRGNGLQPTWPEGWGPLMIPIDHALHTRGLGSERRHTGPALGSAHRPVVVEVGWRG